MEKSEIRDIAETLMGNGITNMVDETGDFKVNLEMITEGAKLYKQFDEQEPVPADEEELRRKKLQNDILEEELKQKKFETTCKHMDRDHIGFMNEFEKQKAASELTDLKERKNKEAWDRGLKIAGIVAPIVGAGITAVTGLILFNKKSELVNETIKLNTILQEKGYISGLNNSKVISDQFNSLLK